MGSVEAIGKMFSKSEIFKERGFEVGQSCFVSCSKEHERKEAVVMGKVSLESVANGRSADGLRWSKHMQVVMGSVHVL
jgi:hypothetical protein